MPRKCAASPKLPGWRERLSRSSTPVTRLPFTLFGKDAIRKELARAELLSVGPDGCTTFALMPEITADGHTWFGQNWDWLEGIHGRNFLLRVRRTSQPIFICLTEAGIVGGKMGINDRGIGLIENGLASSHDGKYPFEKPFHMRCREVLDAADYESALRPILETRRTCSANFVIGHSDGEIIDLETSPDQVAYLRPEEGIITHSNHFVAPGHGESQMEKIAPISFIAHRGYAACSCATPIRSAWKT